MISVPYKALFVNIKDRILCQYLNVSLINKNIRLQPLPLFALRLELINSKWST